MQGLLGDLNFFSKDFYYTDSSFLESQQAFLLLINPHLSEMYYKGFIFKQYGTCVLQLNQRLQFKGTALPPGADCSTASS